MQNKVSKGAFFFHNSRSYLRVGKGRSLYEAQGGGILKRMILVVLAISVMALSGCVGLHKADFINAKMVPVINQQGDRGSAFSFSSTKFANGTWEGSIVNGFASGSGTLTMFDKAGNQSGVFTGTLQTGKAVDTGTLFYGKFGENGNLVNPIIVYNGAWNDGLPNGGGKLEVYGEDGRLVYFLHGFFKNGTVDGPYFHFNPNQGTWSSTFNDSEHQKRLVID